MAISSEVSICNLAASHLGVDYVNNIKDPTTRIETVFNQYYDIARQTLYRDCFFQFSIAQLILPEDTETPTFVYSHQSAELPQDVITFMYLYLDGQLLSNNGKRYRIYGNRLQSELVGSYRIVYIKDITDANKMTPEFKLLLSFYLATLVSESVGASQDKKNFVTMTYTKLLEKAKSNNAFDNTPFIINDSNYIEAYVYLNGNGQTSGWAD